MCCYGGLTLIMHAYYLQASKRSNVIDLGVGVYINICIQERRTHCV